jgi:hypothetical protein
MRVPRMQFTLRRMMLAVAGAAVMIWGVQTTSRWRLYRARAQHHALEHARLSAELAPALAFKQKHDSFPGCALSQAWLETACERAEWNALLTTKYQRAAFHPWLPTEPDPPEPN